jgi:ribosome maturation factor RimP
MRAPIQVARRFEVGSWCPTFFIWVSWPEGAMADQELARLIEGRVEELGYEVVELERAGSSHRPILRLRIDRPAAAESQGITHEDCRLVSRALEEMLDAREELAPRYVLEVSSPGVERPLVRASDFRRFAGQAVVLQGAAPLGGRARRLEGELLGIDGEGGEERVRLRLPDGTEVEVPRVEITRAHLAFHWGGGGRAS